MSWHDFWDAVTLGGYSLVFGDEDAGKDAADYQNKINVQNWEMQNEYNHPKNQMARYEDAGLNPNLIYTSQNTAGDVGGVTVKPRDSFLTNVGKFANIAATVQGLKAGAANIANTRANTENTIANTRNMYENMLHTQASTDNLKATNSLLGTQNAMAEAELDRYRYETKKMKERGVVSSSGILERNLEYALHKAGDLPRRFSNYVGGKIGTFVGDQITSGLSDELKRVEAVRKAKEFRQMMHYRSHGPSRR